MLTRRILVAAAMTSMSIGAIAMAAPIHLTAPVEEAAPEPLRRRRRSTVAQSAARYRRARGPQAKPKRRTNMVRLGRRVRRKHRRAA